MILDRVASVYRTVTDATQAGGYGQPEVFKAIRCAIVPISKQDQVISYSQQSTHIIWVEGWLKLRKQDEVRWGRRGEDAFGNVTPEVYVIDGRARYTLGAQLITYYATARD